MQTPIYYIDAFTDKLFSGNPAAVVFSDINDAQLMHCLLYTSPSPRDVEESRMPSSA